MANSDVELREEVSEFTGTAIGPDELDTAIERAQKHIKIATQRTSPVDWYDDETAENAVFWWSCLFTKVASGELDAQTFKAGSIEAQHLPSGESGTWLRRARAALDTMSATSGVGMGITAPEREDRVYGEDGVDTGGDIL